MRRNKLLRHKLRRQNSRIGLMLSQKPLRSLVFTTLTSMATGITIGYLLKK